MYLFVSYFSLALRYGTSLLGSLSAVSAFVINNHFRRKLKLGNYGRFASYLPIVALPSMITIIFHKAVGSIEITNKL